MVRDVLTTVALELNDVLNIVQGAWSLRVGFRTSNFIDWHGMTYRIVPKVFG